MYNEDLFNKLATEFPTEAMARFCLMTSRMYDHMYKEFLEIGSFSAFDPRQEYEHQRQWWLDKFFEISRKVIINNKLNTDERS